MDPLSALLASDDGSSSLFDVPPSPPSSSKGSPKPTIANLTPAPDLATFDASKVKVKASKRPSKCAVSEAVKKEGGEISRGGFGVDVFSKNAGHHVEDNGIDLFGNSAPLYGEGNIPGDLFDKGKVEEVRRARGAKETSGKGRGAKGRDEAKNVC